MLEKRRNSGDLDKFSVYTATLANYVEKRDEDKIGRKTLAEQWWIIFSD